MIEGEGTFYSSESSEGYLRFRLEVEMTDEDVVRHAHEITGVGNVTTRNRTQPGKERKQVWRWTVGAKEEFVQACVVIFPWMGERRSEKIRELLSMARREDLIADHYLVHQGQCPGDSLRGQLGADQAAA